MTLRWRLALTYAGLLTLTLLLAGSVSYAALNHTLYVTLDSSLKVFAEKQARIESGSAAEPPASVSEALDILNRQQPIRLTVYDTQGREVDWGPSRVGFSPGPGVSQVGQERVFMLRTPGGWIQTTQSDHEVRAPLRQILLLELLGVPFVLLLSLGVGYVLADRALRPVDQVSDLAARIAHSGQPGERVPQAPGGDELSRLTRTINDMLTRLDAQLAHERLFAHASAHELRTPLSVIRAATSLALEQERSPEQYRAALEQVQAVSEDMSALTARLMALARTVRPPQAQAVNLADVALMVTELHADEARRRNVRIQVTPDDAATTGDFDALVVAAGNLVQNAVRHSPPGTFVQVWSGTKANTAHLTVQDAGPGIPEAEVPRLLRPFQRGELGGGGAGLGLALVQAVVSAHGGHLQLTTLPLSGLRAELRLPRIQEPG